MNKNIGWYEVDKSGIKHCFDGTVDHTGRLRTLCGNYYKNTRFVKEGRRLLICGDCDNGGFDRGRTIRVLERAQKGISIVLDDDDFCVCDPRKYYPMIALEDSRIICSLCGGASGKDRDVILTKTLSEGKRCNCLPGEYKTFQWNGLKFCCYCKYPKYIKPPMNDFMGYYHNNYDVYSQMFTMKHLKDAFNAGMRLVEDGDS